jgi:Cu+-exporting ATPase
MIAQKLGIKRSQGSALPQDKVNIVRELQASGKRVGMVGDGVNDAGALAQADVGFAVGSTWNILREASDITLLTGNVESLPSTLNLSRLTTTVMKQNLLLAFFYNALGIPLAVAGLLNPLVAVLAMFASSLTVLANTLRISRISRD